MKYFVKTRNFYDKKWVFNLLAKTKKYGVNYWDAADNDCKFELNTNNKYKALAIWLYFMMLKHFSGGWTYIVRTDQDINSIDKSGYKAIYWNNEKRQRIF